MCGDILGCHRQVDEDVLLHLVSRGKGCSKTSYNAQDSIPVSLPTARNKGFSDPKYV